MNIQMTHAEGFNTFEHIRRNIELEEERLKATGPKTKVHMALFSGLTKNHHKLHEVHEVHALLNTFLLGCRSLFLTH